VVTTVTEVVVLIDYRRSDGNDQGIIMDMGDDLILIAEQLRMIESSPPPGLDFLGALVLQLHEDQPGNFYIPENAFGEGLALDGSAQLPIGKRWFSLIMKVDAGAFEEEE